MYCLILTRGKVEVTSNISNAVIFKISLHTFKLLPYTGHQQVILFRELGDNP